MVIGECRIVDIWCTSFKPIKDRRMYLTVASVAAGCNRDFLLTGTADKLARLWWYDQCPVGVLLDRLQEYPEEAQPVPGQDWNKWEAQVIIDAVQWIRVHRRYWCDMMD